MKQFIQKLKSSLKQSKQPKTILDQSKIENNQWFMPNINRQETENYLSDKEIGVFVVRQSESQSNCFVLSIRVPKYMNANEISHYLILTAANGAYRLKGFLKEFSDIKALVTHCSVIRDMLPVLLNLRFFSHGSEIHIKNDNYMIYSPSTSSLISFNSVGSLSSNVSY